MLKVASNVGLWFCNLSLKGFWISFQILLMVFILFFLIDLVQNVVKNLAQIISVMRTSDLPKQLVYSNS